MRNTIKNKKQVFESQFSVKTYGEQNGEISVSDKSFYDLYYRVLDRIYDALKECLEMYGEEKIPLSVVGFREYDFLCIAQDRVSFDRDGYYYDIQSIEFVELCDLTDKLYDYCLKKVGGLNENKKSVYNEIMEKLSVIVKQSLKENEYWDEPFRDDEQLDVVDIQGDTEKWINCLKVFFEDIYDDPTLTLKFYVTIKQLDMNDTEQLENFVWTLMPIATKYVNCPPVDEVFVQSIIDEIKGGLCKSFIERVQNGYTLI